MSNNKDPAFLFYSSDFLVGVSDLTMEERGQYITLICIQHAKGHLSEKNIKIAVGDVSKDVLAKFEIDENGLYYNSRLEKEMLKRENYAKSRYENGCKGGRPKKTTEKPYGFENETICQTIAKPTQNHSENENININDNENIDLLFNIFWKEYPKKINKDYAYKCFIKLKPTKELVNDMVNAIKTHKKWKGWQDNKFIPYPSTWLNQGGWKDELPQSEIDTFGADEFFEIALKRSYGDDWKGI